MARRLKKVIVRAKVKKHIPLDWQCCQWFEDKNASYGEMLLDLGKIYRASDGEICCHSCNSAKPAHTSAPDTDGLYMPLELLDLDETGVANGNYVESPAEKTA